MGGAGVT
jgi:hypothetical protein